jgi:flagellar biosynthesis protein FlhG
VAAPVRSAAQAEALAMRRELARMLGPDTEFSGEVLRKVREAQGVELSDVTARTKIPRSHLEAIEDERFDVLPAPVYVRGFLGEIAKFYDLDAVQVQTTYLRRMKKKMAAGGRG